MVAGESILQGTILKALIKREKTGLKEALSRGDRNSCKIVEIILNSPHFSDRVCCMFILNKLLHFVFVINVMRFKRNYGKYLETKQ